MGGCERECASNMTVKSVELTWEFGPQTYEVIITFVIIIIILISFTLVVDIAVI